jgi:Ca2+:H+ antiporter
MLETKYANKTFIGLILLPMLGNATERITAVAIAYKGKMDLAISVAIGGSMQIALFVIRSRSYLAGSCRILYR